MISRKEEGMCSIRRRRGLAFVLALLITCMGLGTTIASAGPKDTDHCIAPSGVDLNERYGVAEQIIAPFCAQTDAGQHWTHSAFWLMATSFESVPPQFVPAGDTPLNDFLAKFVSVKYVVDPGTPQQQTYIVPKSDKLWSGVIDGFPAVNTLTLSSLNPLSVGQHVVEVSWVFSAMHCDGVADNISENCFPAGETLYATTAFEVVPGHY